MAQARYGRRKYMRSQVVAIVAGYWRKGLTREEIAKKLGISRTSVRRFLG